METIDELKTKKTNEVIKMLERLGACSGAVKFASKFETFEQAWNACERGDWMLWLASKLKVNVHILTLAKALCAETVIHLMHDERSRNAVRVAKQFGRYKATKTELNASAADAAYSAAADAAYSAADAAYSAAADAAYSAADAAYSAAAKIENQKKTADICRKVLTKSVFSNQD